MEDLAGPLLFTLAALVLSIIALAKVSSLKAGMEELKRRLSEIETRGRVPTAEPIAAKLAIPPPLPDFVKSAPIPSAPSIPPIAKAPASAAINWESILGVKLFAWIGGFALFLGVVFFIKYAFDNNWITAEMRIVAGAIVGTSLVIVSLLRRVRNYRTPAQSVCGTGMLILYADIYAAHSFYGLISLTAATALMWIVTAVALIIATGLNVQSVAWLAIIGGFLTPFLFRESHHNSAWVIFGYLAIFDCAIAAVATLRRWKYFILVAAVGSVGVQSLLWQDIVRRTTYEALSWYSLLGLELLFLSICAVLSRPKLNNAFTIAAVGLAGAPALMFAQPEVDMYESGYWSWHVLKVIIGVAAMLAVGGIARDDDRRQKVGAGVACLALGLTCFNDWLVWGSNFGEFVIPFAWVPVLWYIALFILFALLPYVSGTKRLWPWALAAVAGPLQFGFVYRFLEYGTGTVRYNELSGGVPCVPHNWIWLVTLAFGIPGAIGIWYLLNKEKVDLASGDSRLATQAAAVVTFVSLIFPVQFEREWITLGWAIEGLALIILFRWIPNRRLRAAAIIVLCAAFVRLALNPAVLEYHPRTPTPILNWYLYAYGVAALCFFMSARWFDQPHEKEYERAARPLLYSFCGIVLFLLMNLEIADYFSIGPTLTFSFSGNFARDMTYTIAWSFFALALLVLGIMRDVRPVRLVGIALLAVAFGKLFLHDLDSLNQLYRIGAFVTVAVIAIVASFVYQRFLSIGAKKT